MDEEEIANGAKRTGKKAAKNAGRVATNEVKRQLKNVAKMIGKTAAGVILPIVLVVLLIIIIFAAGIEIIKLKDCKTKEHDDSNVGCVATTRVTAAMSSGSIAGGGSLDAGGSYGINTDTMAEDIIKILNENESRLSKYIPEEKQKEYISAFIKAETYTQCLDLRTQAQIDSNVPAEGCIKLQRGNSAGTTSLMTYVNEEFFNQLVANYEASGDTTVLNHFTVNANGELIAVSATSIYRKVENTIPGEENVEETTTFKAVQQKINYRETVKSYTMPFEFLWSLTVMSDSADLAYEVAKSVLDSEIVITMYDNVNTTETTSNYTETVNVDTEKKLQVSMSVHGGNYNSNEVNYDIPRETKTYECNSVEKIVNNSPTLILSYVDIWYAKYDNSSKNTSVAPETKTTEINEVGEPVEEELELEKDENGEYVDFVKYSEDKIASMSDDIKGFTTIKFDGYTYKKITTTSTVGTTTTTTSSNKYEKGIGEVTPKTDKNSKTPTFVSILCSRDYEYVKETLNTKSLFKALEQNQSTADMLDTVKYLLQVVYDEDYGVKDLNFSIYEPSSFNGISTAYGSGDVLYEFLKSYESTNTRQGGKFKPLASKDDVYMIHSYTGDPTIGYGIYIACNLPIFQEFGYFTEITQEEWSGELTTMKASYDGKNRTSRYKSAITMYHENECNYYVDGGKPLYNIISYETYKSDPQYAKYKWGTEVKYVSGTDRDGNTLENKRLVVIEAEDQIIPSEVIDKVAMKIIQNMRDSIVNKGLDLKPNQIDALVVYKYCFGNINGFDKDNPEAFFAPLASKHRYEQTLMMYNEGIYLDKNGNEIVVEGAFLDDWLQDGIAGKYTNAGRTYTLYKQEYGGWQNEYYCTGGSYKTIGRASCGPTSLLIVMSGLGETRNPVEFIHGENIQWYGATAPMATYLQQHNVNAYWGGRDDQKILEHLKSGNPLIFLVNNYTVAGHTYAGHYIAVLGINKEGQIFFGDSGGCRDATTGYHETSEVLNSGITNVLYITIE